jgi:hypothetical protein
MSKKNETQSPIDEAFLSAVEDRKFANFFYDTFLNATLFMPIKREGDSESKGEEIGIEEKFFPFFLSLEKFKAVPVFDSLDRLQTWSNQKKLDYLKIKAHLLLKILDPSVAVFLNGGTPSEYIMLPEILELLRNSMKPITPA